jgi:inner membrane protein
MSNELVWFIVGLVLLLSELAIPGFIIMFFGVGAWIVAILLWLGIGLSFSLQLFIFLIGSLGSLVLFRRYGKKYFKGRVNASTQSLEDVKGEKVTVVADIVPNSLDGKVEFHGTIWNAESDVAISKGSVVEVIERNNLTLKVKEVK